MITTIYNLIMVFISLTLIYIGDVKVLYILYFLMCFGAIFITHSVSKVLKDYPNVTTKTKESIHFVFYDEYGIRMANYIGSYICHALILGYMLSNIPATIAISFTVLYRMLVLNKGYNAVKLEKSK